MVFLCPFAFLGDTRPDAVDLPCLALEKILDWMVWDLLVRVAKVGESDLVVRSPPGISGLCLEIDFPFCPYLSAGQKTLGD